MGNLLILGAGQFGQVTKEIAESLDQFDAIDFLDDNSELAIGKISELNSFADEYDCLVVAIDNNNVRKELIEKARESFKICSIISPKAYISKSSKIGEGSIIEPLAYINANSTIGEGCIICAGAIINHNSIIGNYSHINCGTIIKSNTKIEEETKVDYGEIK